MRRVLAVLAVLVLLTPACDEPVAPAEEEVRSVLAPVDNGPAYALAVANAAVEFGPVTLASPSPGIWESVGTTSDPTIRDARLSQTCGGSAEMLGQLYQMTRYFGEARCYPYVRFTATGLISLKSLRFVHIHNHNPGFSTNPSYEVQLQIRTVGLTNWRDLGTPVVASPATYGATSTVALLSMLLELYPGTYDIRWVPRGLNGSDTNSEFFGLRSVSLGLTTFPAPLVTLASSPGEDRYGVGGVFTSTAVTSDAGVVTGELTQTCGGATSSYWGDGFIWHLTRQFGADACYPEIRFNTDRIVKLRELEFHHHHNHNPGHPTYYGYKAQLQLASGGGWVDVGSPVTVTNATALQTDVVGLGDRQIPPGQHRLRWVPRNLVWGTNTGTEFFSLRSVVLSMEPVPTPPMRLSVVSEPFTNPSSGVYEATAATSDPTLVTGRLTQNCGGFLALGSPPYLLTRYFGSQSCYPEIRFTTALPTTPSGIQFLHAHNHNPRYPTYPSYSAQLQLYRNGGWTDVGAPILLSNQTSYKTDFIALGGLEIPAGEQRLRWIPVGLHGSTNTDTEFFALRDIVLGFNNAPPVAVATAPAAGAEGASLTFSGSGSTDPEGHALDYTWDFGDDGPLVQGESVTHSWARNGTFVVTLTVTDGFAGGSKDTRTVTIANVAPTVAAIPDVSILEAETYTHTGSFTDPGDDSWTATVDYGDGAGAQALTLSGEGGKAFTLGHTYARAGTYTVTVRVTDDDGGVGTGTATVAVGNVPPAVQLSGGATLDEGGIFSGTGSFTDPGSATWTATVDYGDGSGEQALTLSGKSFALSHTYADDGTYTVRVRVSDALGHGDAAVDVVVRNVPPTLTAFDGAGILEGGTYTASTSFTDPGADQWMVEVDYGDGASATFASTGAVDLSHAYADNGEFTVTVTVRDDDEGTVTESATVVVENVAPTVDAGPDGSVAEGSLYTSAGGFTDPGADSWAATVNYGAGAGSEGLSLAAKAFALAYTYADNGTFEIGVSVTDDDGGTGADVARVEVTNVAPTSTFASDASVAEGSSFNLALMNPVDPSTADVAAGFAYALDCGDGAGLVAGEAARSCPTEQDGTRSVRGTIRDKDDGESAYAGTVSVYNVPPTVGALPDAELMEGETYATAGSFTDPGADPWSATVAYEGTPESLSLSGMTFALSHLYATAGTYALEVVVFDDDASGGSGAVVVVLSAAQAATALSDEIQDLVSAGELTTDEAKVLSESLASAAASLEKGNTSAALGQMGAFDNKTNALVRSGRLDAETAALLLDYSSRIQDSIVAKGGGKGRNK